MIDFQDFDYTDNERYLNYLSRCIQIPSNASPMMVLAAKEKHDVKRAYVDNLCWQKFSMGDIDIWAAPAGDWDEIDWKKVFAAHVPKGTIFNFVPEYLLKIWQREFGASIEIEEDRDYWDYILYIDRMENLSGKKLKSFRNAKNAFEKKYNYEVEEITPKIFDELRAFQAKSEEDLQERVDNVEFAQDDNDNFLYALEHWDELKNLFGFVIRVDGQIVAYSLDEQIDETHSIAPFAKSDYNFTGVNQFAYWYDAKINLERGILTENIMDDVGEENLRFFKEHLYPLVMLKKYNVTYKPAAEIQKLKFSSQRDEENLTVKISGRLDTNSAISLKIKFLLELDGVKNLTVDLDGLEYISSSGLRVLIAAMKKIRAQGGTMTIKNIGEQVREVLNMTGFSQIFNVEV